MHCDNSTSIAVKMAMEGVFDCISDLFSKMERKFENFNRKLFKIGMR